MIKIVSLLIFLSSFNALALNPIKVAVIDTGLDLKYSQFAHLCPKEHKDFTGEGFNDRHGHGTNVIGLIVNNAQSDNYCIVIIKAYAADNTQYLTKALEYAYQIKANVINLSGGGRAPIDKEEEIVQKILNANITLVVAAGNYKMNLDFDCNYYPACYDSRIYVIGSPGSYSNYGKTVDLFYDGDKKPAFGQKLKGTSMSAAIFTGKLLKYIDSVKKDR